MTNLLEEILSDLDSLIGLENIKNKVREYIDYVSFCSFVKNQELRKKKKSIYTVFSQVILVPGKQLW